MIMERNVRIRNTKVVNGSSREVRGIERNNNSSFHGNGTGLVSDLLREISSPNVVLRETRSTRGGRTQFVGGDIGYWKRGKY